MISAAEWYDPNPDLALFYQGDVLADIPFFVFPSHSEKSKEGKWKVLRPRFLKGRTYDEVMKQVPADLTAAAAKDVKEPPVWGYPLGEYIMATARLTKVMIVTRSCVIDKPSSKHYLIAPVIAIHELPEAMRTDANLGFLRNNEFFDSFYLPETVGLAESFADLSQMTPVHWTFVGECPTGKNLMARLSGVGTAALQSTLSDHYGTKFGFSFKDRCSQTGVYRCSTCFYDGQDEIPRRTLKAGEIFGPCPECKEEALWVKMPER